jgi:cell division protein FtsL
MSAVESWFAPVAAVVEPLPGAAPRKRASAKAKPKAKAKPRQRRSPRVRASLVWMVVFAVLLVGVVAVNVAVLRANVSVNDLDAQIAQRQQEIAILRSEYARNTASARVIGKARKAGLSPASSAAITTIDMASGK